MAAAFVLRDVYYVEGEAEQAHRGDVVIGLDGRVVATTATAGSAVAPAIHEVHGHGNLLVLPGLANAFVAAPTATAEAAAHRETLLRQLLHRSLAAGVTAVCIGGEPVDDALLARLRTASAVDVTVAPERGPHVVTARESLTLAAAAPLPVWPADGVALGTGSLSGNNGSVWQELQTFALLQRQRGVPAAASQLLRAARQQPLAVGTDANLAVVHVRPGLDHPSKDLLGVLLRTSDADVVGTFVRGKLAHQTEHLSGRVTVVNIGDSGLDVAAPQTNGHGATGLSYPNKTPDVPLERPATASGCEFDSLEDAIKDIADGKFVVVVDNEDRENEGDLIIAADAVTTEKMAFLIRYTSGLVCCAVAGQRLDELRLPLMVEANTESHKTAFTHSVDFLHGTSTGISAADRAATCRALATPSAQAADFARPGHIFPLRYTEGGVLKRMGHTEASIDLCKLAGRFPAGVLCEIALDDGSMARRDFLRAFSRYHGLKMITIADMIRYRRERNLYDF